MNTPSLNNLIIENLRGSSAQFNLSFEKGKNLTIIYGDNGTGKSTIADALDLLGNGKVGSLDTRGIGKTNKYWPTIGKRPLEIEFVSGGIYRYTGVPHPVHTALLGSTSKGTFFHARIKDRFPTTRIR